MSQPPSDPQYPYTAQEPSPEQEQPHTAAQLLAAYASGERSFAYWNLNGASLRNAILKDANFYGANLTGADLSGADLTRANFAHASLRAAILRGANISDAYFEDASTDYADMTDVITDRTVSDNVGPASPPVFISPDASPATASAPAYVAPSSQPLQGTPSQPLDGYGAPTYIPSSPGYVPPDPVGAGPKNMSMIEQLITDAKLVVLHPSVASFDAIQSHTNMGAVLLSIGAVGAAYGIGTLLFAPGAGLFAGLIGTFFGFFLSTSLTFFFARMLGGLGKYTTFAYAQAVADLPLGVIDGLTFGIPVLNVLSLLLNFCFGTYLSYLAIRSVHKLSVGKTLVVTFVPSAILVFLWLCVAVVVILIVLSLGTINAGN